MLQNVAILRTQTTVEVHIEASGAVKPVAMTLSQPDRIVVDLPNVSYDNSRCFAVNSGDVQGVRVALFHYDPPVARVVVDLAHQRKYQLLSAGKRVTIIVDTRLQPAAAARPDTPKTVAAVAPALPPPSGAIPSPAASALTAPVDAPKASVPEPEAKLPPVVQPEAPPQPTVQPSATQPAAKPEHPVSTDLPQVATLTIPPAHLSEAAASEETTPHQAAKANKPGVVNNVAVLRGKDAIEIHIESTKPLRASASTLSNPERIIIDLADARLPRPRHILVNAADVQAVDCSLYLVNPLVTRVVVNLAHARPFHLLTYGSSLIVKIETDEMKTAGSQPLP